MRTVGPDARRRLPRDRGLQRQIEVVRGVVHQRQRPEPVGVAPLVPVATLFDYLADGRSLDYFLESFPTVSRDQAAAVIRYGLDRIERELA